MLIQHHVLEKFFSFKHLPEHLQEVSAPFADLASHLVATLSSRSSAVTDELEVALRKLLEAKDAAVRARILNG